MSRIKSNYRFVPSKRPSAKVLQTMWDWLCNMVSLDGSILVRQNLGVINFQLNPSVRDTWLHAYKLWLKKSGVTWYYAICEQHPDTTGTPLAGRVINPDGTHQTVAKVAWTAITDTTSWWVRLEITEGVVTVTIVTTEPTVAMHASTAVLKRYLGTITFTSGIPAITLNPLQSDVSLEGEVIAAYYANYESTACEQILCHGKTGGPKWYLDAGDGKRVMAITDADTLDVIAPESTTTQKILMSYSNDWTFLAAAAGTQHQILMSHDGVWSNFTGTTAGGHQVVYFDGDDFLCLATNSSSTEYILTCDSSAIAWIEGDGPCPGS